jgi:hypothetical protein
MPVLSIIFWAFFASYIIHILDETLINGGFVAFISKNFWPTYHMRMFFWFNAALIISIATANLLFDAFGGHWVILPLFFVGGFATHVLTLHLFWTIRLNTYSPGLLSSLLYLVIFYLVVNYGLRGHLINSNDFAIGIIAGVAILGVFLTIGPTVLFPRIMRRP